MASEAPVLVIACGALAREIVALDTAFDDQHLVFPDLGALGFQQFVEHRDFKRRGTVVDLDEGHLAARREFAAHADYQAGKQLRLLPGFECGQRPAYEARHFGLDTMEGVTRKVEAQCQFLLVELLPFAPRRHVDVPRSLFAAAVGGVEDVEQADLHGVAFGLLGGFHGDADRGE